MLPVPKELGHCVGWRRCPDVRPDVLWCCPLACPLQRRSPAQPPRPTEVAGFQSREHVPGVPLFEPFSGLPSTSVCVSFLFSELIELGTGLSGALPLSARGCASQEAKAAKSGPARAEGAPKPLWGPACQFLPSAKSSPRAQLGGVWAVRPAWDICSRQSRIKGERWAGGCSEPTPQSRVDACFLDRRRRQQGTLDSQSFFFPLGKSERIVWGK